MSLSVCAYVCVCVCALGADRPDPATDVVVSDPTVAGLAGGGSLMNIMEAGCSTGSLITDTCAYGAVCVCACMCVYVCVYVYVCVCMYVRVCVSVCVFSGWLCRLT